MNFKITISNEVDKKEWNDQLLQSKASSTYQTYQWAKLYQQTFDSIPIFLQVEDSKGKIVGQLTALIHKKFFWYDTNIISKYVGLSLNLQSLLVWSYGPIIYDDSYSDEITSLILDSINKIAIKNKVTIIKGTPSPLSTQFTNTVFQKHAFELDPWSTYVIDLRQNVDELYNSLDKKTRYDIRKSEKNELEFELVDNRSGLTEYQELKFDEKKNAGERLTRHSIFLDNRWDLLLKSGLEKLFLVRYKGNAIGGILNETFNGNVIQYGVVNSEQKELLGGSFLTWHAIIWSMNEKYLTYDMAGAHPFPDTEKEKQIRFYKSKWNGKQIDYMRYTKVFGKTKLRISKAVKEPKRIHRKINKIFHNV